MLAYPSATDCVLLVQTGTGSPPTHFLIFFFTLGSCFQSQSCLMVNEWEEVSIQRTGEIRNLTLVFQRKHLFLPSPKFRYFALLNLTLKSYLLNLFLAHTSTCDFLQFSCWEDSIFKTFQIVGIIFSIHWNHMSMEVNNASFLEYKQSPLKYSHETQFKMKIQG